MRRASISLGSSSVRSSSKGRRVAKEAGFVDGHGLGDGALEGRISSGRADGGRVLRGGSCPGCAAAWRGASRRGSRARGRAHSARGRRRAGEDSRSRRWRLARIRTPPCARDRGRLVEIAACAAGDAKDFRCDRVEGKDLVGEAGGGDGAGHSPDGAGWPRPGPARCLPARE